MTAVALGRAGAAAIAFGAGLAIGSFLNVVIYRSPRGLSVVRPGSFCPRCDAPIRGYDNVPVVSWVLLRGRCRHCRAPISVRYPAVELLTGLVFGLVAAVVGVHWAVLGLCALLATILVLAVVEVDRKGPPAIVAYIGTVLGVALIIAAAILDRRWWRLGGTLIGLAVASAACALAARTKGGAPRLSGAPVALLPAGALVGWLGLVGAGIGAGVMLGGWLLERSAPHGPPGPDDHSRARVGSVLIVGSGVVAAMVGAWATGGVAGG